MLKWSVWHPTQNNRFLRHQMAGAPSPRKGLQTRCQARGNRSRSLIAGDAEDEETRAAVENFIFEVSAGKSSGSRRRDRGSIGKISPAARPANDRTWRPAGRLLNAGPQARQRAG